MDIHGFKGLSVASTWVISVIGLCVPLCLFKGQAADAEESARVAAILSTLNSLSAGVFLTAGLMHLLPEAIENHELEELSEEFWGSDCLHAIALCCAGFILLVGIEQLAHGYMDESAAHGKDADGHGHGHGDALAKHLLVADDAGDSDPTRPDSVQGVQNAHGTPLLAALIVSLALSFHSVIEGLALGAQADIDHAFGILIAVLGHKALESCALGNMLLDATRASSRCRRLAVMAYLGVFTLLTPAGIAIAWLLTHDHDRRRLDEDHEHDHGTVWTAVFSGLGAGTFLYIAAVELLPQELHSHRTLWRRASNTAAFLVGAVAMGMLAKGHDH